MEQIIAKELRLETLGNGIPALTSSRANVHMEACVWCLLECGHSNKVQLNVLEDQNNTAYQVSWPKNVVDESALFRVYNADDGPEDGAVAIALLLIRERTDYTAIRRAVTRTGIDYWLSYKTQGNQIFSEKDARLEVSGILRESPTNKLKYRVAKKLQQTSLSDYTSFPAYIVVVEFSHPKAQMVLKHVTR